MLFTWESWGHRKRPDSSGRLRWPQDSQVNSIAPGPNTVQFAATRGTGFQPASSSGAGHDSARTLHSNRHLPSDPEFVFVASDRDTPRKTQGASLRRIALPCDVPIRRKKSTHFPRGRPESFLISLGRPYPTRTGVSCRGLPRLGPAQISNRVEPCGLPLALCQPSKLLDSSAPGEAESGSAGVQPDKEYPGRRCADGASDP